MRLLTSFEDLQVATLFRDALGAEGISATINETKEGSHALWVHEEDRMDDARAMLQVFDASDRRFSEMAKTARAQRREQRKKERELQERVARIQDELQARATNRLGNLTIALMILCIVVFFFTGQGDDLRKVSVFTLTKFRFVDGRIVGSSGLEILGTEPWRLITPMFIHFGWLHIIFNMMWLKDLGTAIERALSSRYLLAMVLVIAITSHLLEFYMFGPSNFGGMSGVVFGLFGFIWIRGRYDPEFPYRMPQQTVFFLLLWFVLCFSGVVGSIANGVHLGGLAVGALWGLLSSGYLRRKFF